MVRNSMSNSQHHPVDKTFAELLRGYRAGLGITQGQLAEALGFSRTTISNWERGEYKPRSAGEAVAVADYFGLSPMERLEFLAAAGFAARASRPALPEWMDLLDNPERQEEALCPVCAMEWVRFEIRTQPGSSAMPICPHCKNAFHAHRKRDGKLVVRPHHARYLPRIQRYGLAAESCPCPHCGAIVDVTIGLDPGCSAVPTCPQCVRKFLVHRTRSGLRPKLLGSGEPPAEPRSGLEQLTMHCPSCTAAATFAIGYRPGSAVQPLCRGCRRLSWPKSTSVWSYAALA